MSIQQILKALQGRNWRAFMQAVTDLQKLADEERNSERDMQNQEQAWATRLAGYVQAGTVNSMIQPAAYSKQIATIPEDDEPRELIDVFIECKALIRSAISEVPPEHRRSMLKQVIESLKKEDVRSWE